MNNKVLYVTKEAYSKLLDAVETATGRRAVYNSWNDDYNGWWTLYFGEIQVEFTPETASFSGRNSITFFKVNKGGRTKDYVSFMSVKDKLPKQVVDIFIYNLDFFTQDLFA